MSISNITSLSHVIQLAVAPVFLLTGIGTILSVLVNRLARIVDRYRFLELQEISLTVSAEKKLLSKRAKLIHWAISSSSLGLLFVCMVIALLFIGEVVVIAGIIELIAPMFILAVLSVIVGLILFLREITIATDKIEVYLK
jgi:hypothetical protein